MTILLHTVESKIQRIYEKVLQPVPLSPIYFR